MDIRKAIIYALLIGVLLWWLYPSRRLAEVAETGTGVRDSSARVEEIHFMGPGGPLSGAMADIVRMFERKSELAHRQDPSRPIYRVIAGQTAARDQVADPTRFLVSVAGGSPPDVIMFDRYAVAEWAARNAFTPLDDFIKSDIAQGRSDTPRPEEYFKATWDEAMFQGRVYGIPMSVDNRAMVVNNDLLRRAGMVDAEGRPQAPRTWEQMRVALRKLTIIRHKSNGERRTLEDHFARVGQNRFDPREWDLETIGFIPMWGNSWLYMFGWMNGGEFASADGTRVTLNDPKIVEALTWVKEVYDELGGYSNVQGFQRGFQGGALDAFIIGRVAIKIDGFWNNRVLGQFGRSVDFSIHSPPMPEARYNAGHTTMSWTGGWAYSIPTTAKNKRGAWELIRFLCSDEAIRMRLEQDRQLAESEGRIFIPEQYPKRSINQWQYEHYIYNNPAIEQKYKDAIAGYNDLLDVARFRPILPVGQLLWNEHVSKTEAALLGRMSPQEALDAGNAIVQRELDRFVNPTPGRPIQSWTWFIVLYLVIVIVAMVLIFAWDTKVGFRSRIGKSLGLSRASREAVVPGSNGSFMRGQWAGGWICASPWIIGFIIFGGGPMLFSLFISFTRYDIINPAEFTGLENYSRMLGDDPLVGLSLWNTVFMVLAVPLGMAVSLGIALLLNQGVRGMAAWRTFFYLPSIVPLVASTLLFVWLLNPQGGLVNALLAEIGITGPRWLDDTSWSKPSLILMGLWGAGGGMIIWLAGLKGIPTSLYEAAAVDGAGPFRQFVSVTLPQLTPYIFFNLIMGLIGTFQVFGQAFIMTQGGPANSTLFYVYHLFNNAFRYGAMGYASALAWLLFLIVLVLTVIQMKLSKRWVHYEHD